MDIQPYLDRIGYTGPVQPDLETLKNLHRLHLLTIPYENLDIHLGSPIRLDENAFYSKLVSQKRGGWCYEMNGLLAGVLKEIGFKVRFLSGSVRDEVQETSIGNHLVLLIELDQPYIADVGFGDGFLEPLPLAEGSYSQGFLNFRIEKQGEHWVVHNHPAGGAKRFDFTLQPYELSQFEGMCHHLQTSPESGFTRKTVCQRPTEDKIYTLRGAILKVVDEQGTHEQVVESQAEYQRLLKEHFGLEFEDVTGLWTKVWASHQEWQKELAVELEVVENQ